LRPVARITGWIPEQVRNDGKMDSKPPKGDLWQVWKDRGSLERRKQVILSLSKESKYRSRKDGFPTTAFGNDKFSARQISVGGTLKAPSSAA